METPEVNLEGAKVSEESSSKDELVNMAIKSLTKINQQLKESQKKKSSLSA